MADYSLRPFMSQIGTIAEWVATDFAGFCPACGNSPDYCQGHGEMGDPNGYAIIEMHDTGNHSQCHENSDSCEFGLDDCVNWESNRLGDCAGIVEKVNGIVICETCRNRDKR